MYGFLWYLVLECEYCFESARVSVLGFGDLVIYSLRSAMVLKRVQDGMKEELYTYGSEVRGQWSCQTYGVSSR